MREAAGSWRRRPLFRLVPLIAIGGLGVLLWRASNPPERRELTLSLRGVREARSLEVQVLGPEGELVQREERFFAQPASPGAVTLSAPLRRGAHRLRAFAALSDGGVLQAEKPLAVDEPERYEVTLRFVD